MVGPVGQPSPAAGLDIQHEELVVLRHLVADPDVGQRPVGGHRAIRGKVPDGVSGRGLYGRAGHP